MSQRVKVMGDQRIVILGIIVLLLGEVKDAIEPRLQKTKRILWDSVLWELPQQ
jgi:hypothetical protein